MVKKEPWNCMALKETPEERALASLSVEGQIARDKVLAQSIAIKHDEGKAPWGLLPFDTLNEILKVLTFGAQKYSARNWEKGFQYDRVFNAVMRHLTTWWQEGTPDPETGKSHLTHAACGILFLLTYEVRGLTGLDNRPCRKTNEGDTQNESPKTTLLGYNKK